MMQKCRSAKLEYLVTTKWDLTATVNPIYDLRIYVEAKSHLLVTKYSASGIRCHAKECADIGSVLFFAKGTIRRKSTFYRVNTDKNPGTR